MRFEREGVRFRKVAIPGRSGQIDRDLALSFHEHGQEADPVRLAQFITVPGQNVVQQLLVEFTLLVVLPLVAQVGALTPLGPGRRIADLGLAALLVDDALKAAEIPIGHGPSRGGRRLASSGLGPQSVLPLLVQVET
jgi:hypothetical protein